MTAVKYEYFTAESKELAEVRGVECRSFFTLRQLRKLRSSAVNELAFLAQALQR